MTPRRPWVRHVVGGMLVGVLAGCNHDGHGSSGGTTPNGVVRWESIDTIYSQNLSDPYIEQAAQEIKTHLDPLKAGPMVLSSAPPAGPAIVLEVNPGLRYLEGRNDEAFYLFADERGINITGRSPVAVRHGAYALLEKLGFRWFFQHPTWNVSPETLPAVSFQEVQEPRFIQRGLGNPTGHRAVMPNGVEYWERWIRRSRLAGDAFFEARHSWYEFAGKTEVAAQDPTAVCYKPDGVTPQQVLPEHPAVIDRAYTYARNYFATDTTVNREGETVRKMSVPISPPDGNLIWCDTWRVDGEYNSQAITDKVYGLTNTVARMLQTEHPGKYASVLNYSWYSEVPTFPLEPNVHVVVCDFARGTALTLQERVERFHAMGVSTGFYGYFDVWPWWKDRIEPPGKMTGKYLADIRTAAEGGADTFYAEASDNWGPKGRLYWLTSKLAWDPDQDPDVLLDDFYARAFGPAKDIMERYYTRFDTQRHTPRVMGLAFEDVAAALEAAAGRPDIQERIRHVLYHTYFWWKWGPEIQAGHAGFASVDDAKAMYAFLWRIRDLHVVTFRLQEETMLRVLTTTLGVPDAELAPLRDPTPPSASEAQAWLDEARANFSGLDLVHVETPRALDLQPFVAADSSLPPVRRIENRLGGTEDILIPSSGAETVTVSMLVSGWFEWIDPSGTVLVHQELNTLCPTGGCWFQNPGQAVPLPADSPGVYTLRIGGWFVVDVPDRMSSMAGPTYKSTPSGYFSVPPGTAAFVAGAGTENCTLTFTRPDGTSLVLTGADTWNEWVVRDPQLGVWRIDVSASSEFWLLGVPPLLWHNPKYLLVPRD
ncbi:MAG: DUF4838 domain-containing protein [Planctomycetes bacterium]|nr:DUF4838 domain-containing protein [Planctomycetota bacterium]